LKSQGTFAENSVDRFRWAACQLDAIKDCVDYPSLEEALTDLPKTLDETYARILASIAERNRYKAITVLRLLTWSSRPLRLQEIVDAIAVQSTKNPSFDPGNRMPVPRDVLSICSRLVMLVKRSDAGPERSEALSYFEEINFEIRLAHLSVKEYLLSDRIIPPFVGVLSEISSRAAIATLCLAYLSELSHSMSLNDLRARFAFAEYSAMHWTKHAHAAGEGDEFLRQQILRFFQEKGTAFSICYSLYDPDGYRVSGLGYGGVPADPLYYASLGGLKHSIVSMLGAGAGVDVNAQSGSCGNALQAASSQGHEEVVQILPETRAEINRSGGRYGNALGAAVHQNHEQIVEVLLRSGALVNEKGSHYFTPLEEAASEGHSNLLPILRKFGAEPNIDTEDGYYSAALYAAIDMGHTDFVKYLLEWSPIVDAPGDFRGSALQQAAASGRSAILAVLIQRNADVHAESQEHGTALIAAAQGGHHDIVQTLLDHHVNVNTSSGRHGTALIAAAQRGHHNIVQTLLDHHADVNTSSTWRGTALQGAAAAGHNSIVTLLLDHQADIHNNQGLVAQSSDTPQPPRNSSKRPLALYLASAKGHHSVVQTLIERSAYVDAHSESYSIALEAAAASGHREIVKFLLFDEAARRRKEIASSYHAFLAALTNGHHSIARLLYQEGRPMLRSSKYGTVLQAASSGCNLAFVSRLLEEDADVNAPDGPQGSALRVASFKGHVEVVRLLLRHGADINAW
jgi:ankyrin repeat protein